MTDRVEAQFDIKPEPYWRYRLWYRADAGLEGGGKAHRATLLENNTPEQVEIAWQARRRRGQ